MTNDEADDHYGSLNVAENNSSRFNWVKLLVINTL